MNYCLIVLKGKSNMEHIIFWTAAAAFLLFLFVQGMLKERKEKKWFAEKLKKEYGELPQREYKTERYQKIPGYYQHHRFAGQIDDITWNDLEMDDIFKRMNYTLSSTGEEYLYYRLRTPEYDEERLLHFQELVAYFDEKEEERVSFQLLMRRLGTTGKYSLYDYIDYISKLDKSNNLKEYLAIIVLFVSIILLFFNLTVGILGVLAVVCYQVCTYFKVRKVIEPYITSLAYMVRLNEIADKVAKLNLAVCESENQELKKHILGLNKAKRGSFWVFHDVRNNTSGNFLDAILVYITMIFHVDLICFQRMRREMVGRIEDIDAIAGLLGYMETAVCVCLFRASMQHEVCIPEFEAGREGLLLVDGYHPMIQEPVKNSIDTAQCVLITGSNASGKSTFLKMVALNVLLAQSIYTVCAKQYKAPLYHLFTSMSLRDNLESGESYYIVEIRAIQRILKQMEQTDGKIICFVDEVLRGTNTTERIAASSQILKSFARKGMICFAATHDLELTSLLQEDYMNYHFEEKIMDNDILFHYQLCQGKATSRNAIRLLQLMGYDEEIIAGADSQAAYFEQTGEWKLS